MADTRLKDRVRGTPLVLSIRNDSPGQVDFATTAVYLFLEREDGLVIRLKYVPGDLDNDGVYSFVSGVQRITFKKPATWTASDSFPMGYYSVWPWIGALDSDAAISPSERAAVMRVKNTESNKPLGVAP